MSETSPVVEAEAEVVAMPEDDWCDDCHSYSHRSDCPSLKRRKPSIEKQIVDAVYRSMQQYEDGTWLLDELRALARVKKVLKSYDSTTAEVAALKGRVEKLTAALMGIREVAQPIIRDPEIMNTFASWVAQQVTAALIESPTKENEDARLP